MNSDTTGNCTRCLVQKACNALIWLQTLVWSFVLVGAVGLSVYCWFENPDPWVSIGYIWTVAGGLTLAVLVSGVLFHGLAGIARKVERSGRNSLLTQ